MSGGMVLWMIDDLDGSPAEGTVRFALDGTSYEIDLSGEHSQALREELSRFTGAARRAPGTRSPARTRRKPIPGDPDSTEIRDWARSQGIDLKDRGAHRQIQSRDHEIRPRSADHAASTLVHIPAHHTDRSLRSVTATVGMNDPADSAR
jgi:hypothetical protein